VVGDRVDEVEIYHKLKAIRPDLVRSYCDIIYLDALVFNVDRHSYNYGFLRSQETGEILSMAPNFDNNIALISRGYSESPIGSNGLLIQDFIKLLEETDESYPIPGSVTEDVVRRIAGDTLPEEDIDRDFVTTFILDRQQRLIEGMSQTRNIEPRLGL